MLTANREVMLVLAGVFLFLPSLAFTLLVPQAEPPSDATPEIMQQFIIDYYASAGPYFLVLGLIQAAGLIAMQALLRDDSKPTVGEAIRIGFVGLLPYLGASLLLGLGLGVVFGLVFGLLVAVGNAALMTLAILGSVLALIYVWVRMSLVTPVIAVDKVMNPIRVLQRSWQLTGGNALMLFVFFLLLFVVMGVVLLLVSLMGNLLGALAGGGTLQALITGIVSGVVGTAFMMIFVAVLAAIHRQLAGGLVQDTFR